MINFLFLIISAKREVDWRLLLIPEAEVPEDRSADDAPVFPPDVEPVAPSPRSESRKSRSLDDL